MIFKYLYILPLLAVLLYSCQDDDELYTDKVYTKSDMGYVLTTRVKKGVDEITKTVRAAVSLKAEYDIKVAYKIDEALVDFYNRAYYDEAVMLPAECYEFPKTEVVIPQGGTESAPLEIFFKNLDMLNKKLVYVLPVTIGAADKIEILESARHKFFVFKAGSLINTVANISNNYLSVDWKNKAPLQSMNEITVEALIRAQNFDHQISTLLGVEDVFLIRFGDASFPPNQLQVSLTNRVYCPSADNTKAMPTNKWVHIAVTYSSESGVKVYVDGKLQTDAPDKKQGAKTLASKDFYIGKSWDDDRYLSGDICECRIWGVIRTEEEIKDNFYMVDPNSVGLVAYWKFDEETGKIVKDYTVNGNNAIADKALQWVSVELPVVQF